MSDNKESQAATGGALVMQLSIAWLWAGIPLIWGITQTLIKATALFQ